MMRLGGGHQSKRNLMIHICIKCEYDSSLIEALKDIIGNLQPENISRSVTHSLFRLSYYCGTELKVCPPWGIAGVGIRSILVEPPFICGMGRAKVDVGT